MESEGTYTIKNTVNDLWLVYGPRGPLSGNIGHALAVAICAAANSGYAEGRKSMEKDFKILWEIAYTSWKKARPKNWPSDTVRRQKGRQKNGWRI